jgi:hypothetical protein
MASTTTVSVNLRINGQEVHDAADVPSAANQAQRTVNTGGNDLSQTLSSTSAPSITKPPISRKVTIGGSPTDLDLTAIQGLTIPSGATRTLDMTGAKLVAAVFRAADANTGAVTVGPSGSNDYALFGSGNDIEVPKGLQINISSRIAAQLPAVSGTAKIIRLSGTSGDIIYVDLYFGA